MHEKLWSTVEVWHPCLGMLQPPPQVRGGECPTRAGRTSSFTAQSKGLAWSGAVGHTHIQLHSLETTILAADALLILSDWGCVCGGGQPVHGWVCMQAQLSRTLPANPEVIHETQKECKKARWKGEAWGRLESDPDFACAHPHPNHSQNQQ